MADGQRADEQRATPIRGCSARSTRTGSTSTSPGGLFMVVDGIGGQAAGGKAADTAVSMLQVAARTRDRSDRPIGFAKPSRSPTTRFIASPASGPNGTAWPASSPSSCSTRRARSSGTWATPGCTSYGTTGSTRSRAITRRSGSARTRMSSPSSKRCTTRGATRSTATSARSVTRPAIPDFIEVQEIPFEPDAALLLCSDGLTDLVESDDDRPNRVAVGRPATAGRPGSHRRRERRRRQGQRHRRLRRRRAVRATGWRRCVSRDHAPAEHGTECVAGPRVGSFGRCRGADVEASAGRPLDAARAAHDRHRACR